MKTTSLVALASATLLFACVSPKKLKQSEEKYNQLNGAYLELLQKYRDCQGNLAGANDQIKGLQNNVGIYCFHKTPPGNSRLCANTFLLCNFH
jgi:chemotaxis protein MotB